MSSPSKKSWYAFSNISTDSADVEIYDAIGCGGISAKDFIVGLKALQGKHLNLRINSPGGSVFDGQAIIAALKRHAAGFSAHVDGLAASMASAIACSAKNCLMSSGSMMMIHRVGKVSAGDADDLRRDASVMEKLEKNLIGIYHDKTGLSEEELAEMLKAETWMDSTEALAMGFADGIVENSPSLAMVTPADLRARFDTFKINMSSQSPTPQTSTAAPADPVASSAPAPAEPTPAPVASTTPAASAPGVSPGEPAIEIENLAPAIQARFATLTNEREAFKALAEQRLASLNKIATDFANLEASLGVSVASKTPEIIPTTGETKEMTYAQFSALPPAAKQAFFRKGGKLID